MRRSLLALALALVAAGPAVWLLTRPPAPDELAERALAAYPERDAVAHQVVETSGWTDRIEGFGFDIESWERRPGGARRVRWVNHGLARLDGTVVDGELVADRRRLRRLWYRSEDGTFVGEWPLKEPDDRREALASAPETVDVVAELRQALRTGLSADNGLEEFSGRERRRITRERRIGGSRVRDSWFIDERDSKLLGMRRERWVGERLEDNLTFRLVRYEQLAPTAKARSALVFTAGRSVDAAAEPAKRCGDTVTSGAGAFDVRAEGVTCRKARRVARTYNDEHEVEGWRCRSRQLDLEYFKARCTRRGAVVRFGYGS